VQADKARPRRQALFHWEIYLGAIRMFELILLLIFFLATLSQIFLGVHFQASAPRKPDSSLGAIYPVQIKADIVYLTSTESYCYNDWIVVLGAVFGVPVMLRDALAGRKRSKRRRAEVPPPAWGKHSRQETVARMSPEMSCSAAPVVPGRAIFVLASGASLICTPHRPRIGPTFRSITV